MTPAAARQLVRGTLAANGWRLALTIACIALGVALGGAIHTIHSSALAEIDRAARALSGTADLEIRGPRTGFDDAWFARVAARGEVAAANPVVEVDAALADGDGSLRVLGIDALRAMRMQPAFLVDANATGSGEVTNLLDANALWLTPSASARLGVGKGGTVRLLAGSSRLEFRVGGVLAGLASAGDAAIVDIAAAQWHFGRLGRLSRIELRLKPGVDTARFVASIDRELPAGVAVSSAASLSGRAAAISKAYRVNLDALALVALATGAFLVFSTLALQAARRRQEFALLRALGVTRAGLAALLALEGAVIGLAGSLLGTLLALVGSRALLERRGADLGAGYFGGHGGAFAPDPLGLAGIALLGIGMSVAGALWVARAVGRIEVAEALRDRAVDLPQPGRSGAWPALGAFLAGIPLLWAPPIGGLPLAGYAAIALWLAASVLATGPICRALLSRLSPRQPVPALALAQVRHLPGHLAASVAGIVVSTSLCIAMAIMVFSFRVSLEEWLNGVVRADLYLRTANAGDTGFLSREQQARIAATPGVASIEPLHYDRLVLGSGDMPVSLVARPIDAALLDAFQAEPPGMPARGAEIPVWISEAGRDLQGWRPGDVIEIPLAGRAVRVRIAGIIRDYARTWTSIMMPLDDYRRLTGDERANDIAIHLAEGTDTRHAEEALRAALPGAQGLFFEDARDLRRRSLAIFDRSFAVTYALEAIAIVIGLAGMTSSFAALAWSRRREFGVLRFLGLTRAEILRMLALEGVAAGALGAAIGLVSGAAISVVLVHVVNRQSFHWSLEVHWPWVALAALVVGVVAACAFGARASAAWAVRHEAVLAVKDDA